MRLLGVFLTALAVLGGAVAQDLRPFGMGEGVERGDLSREPELPELAAGSVVERIQALSLRQRVEQLMFVSLSRAGESSTSEDRAFLKDVAPGGVLVPTVLRPRTAAHEVIALRTHPNVVSTGIPMFIGTNLWSLPRTTNLSDFGYFSQLPSLLAIAAAGDDASPRVVAELAARQLKTMGFNLNVGPYLSLSSSLPGAPGVVQTFGSDPGVASNAAEIMVRTYEDAGVLALPVSFPGGGLNRSPGKAAVLTTPQVALRETDLAPFEAALEAGAKLMHVGTTVVPTIAGEPRHACLAPEVMRGLLRDELGFEGIIVAGPMDDSTLLDGKSSHEASILALAAGADMLLWRQLGGHVEYAVGAVVNAVKEGALPQEVIDAALARVLLIKDQAALAQIPLPDPDTARKLANDDDFAEEAYKVERRAVTVVVNRGGVLPLTEAKSEPIAVTGVAGVSELREALEEHFDTVGMQRISTARQANRVMSFEIDRAVRHADGLKTAVVVASDSVRPHGQAELVQALRGKGAQVVVVLLGYPEDLPSFFAADAVVCVYGHHLLLGESMRAAASVLTGNAPIGAVDAEPLELERGQVEVFDVYDYVRTPSGRLPVTIDTPFLAGLSLPYDPRRALREVRWNFGDGETEKGERVEHAYDAPGRYPVSLTTVDQEKEEREHVFYVHVR